jgi:L,D-transpeptidase YcbB
MKSPNNRSLRHAAFAAAVALVVVAGCDVRRSRGDDGTHTSEAGGDVTRAWNPQAVADVKGVQGAAVRAAISARLAKPRPGGIGDDHWAHVKRLYKHYADSPLWLDGGGLINARATAMTNALLAADQDALDVSEYPLSELGRAMRTLRETRTPTAEQLADADVLLTSAYAALGEDMLVGQVRPTSVNQSWFINPRDEAIDGILLHGLATDALDSSLAAMRPKGEDYAGLRQALAHYRDLAAKGGWGTVPPGRALKPGEHDSPARLDALRARLRAEGYDVAASPAPVDSVAPAVDSARRADRRAPRAPATGPGVYDHALAGAVAQFQATHAIDVDSILGPGTVDAMNKPVDYRVAQIAANLERYRWLPRSLGTRYIYVNIPAFRLQAFDSGRTVLDMKVVVGQNYQDKTTPAFADSMEYVVFRPYWNITPDIQEKEIEPKIADDPSYMEENQLEYYKDGGQTRIRQKPGDKNSLGYVKFLFPNDFNIYLHDTPAKDLFDKDVRAFSHGCIRVEKPAELAQWVLGWPADKVDEAMHSGPDNRTVKLPQKIPVFITYFTAFVQDGALHFGNDLYDRDDALVAAAAKAAQPNPAVEQAIAGLKQLASK